MAGDLAAEGRVVLAHRLLEERVADAVHVRGPAVGLDRVGHGAAGADVVDDPRAGLLGEHAVGEQRGEEVAVDELAPVVDEEAAVGVPVPGDPEVGALGEHAVDDELAVLGQQRVRLVVGELAVGDPVGLDRVEAEAVEQRADHRPGHPVAAVDDHPQRLDRARVDERERVLAELLVDVDGLDAGRRPAPRARPSAIIAWMSPIPASPESASAPSRTQLHPGVGLRVVRGGDHRPAVELARADEEIEHLGADHPGVEHGRALGDQPGDAPRAPSPAPSAACRARRRPAARPAPCRAGRRAPGRRRGRSRAPWSRPSRRRRGRGCRRP